MPPGAPPLPCPRRHGGTSRPTRLGLLAVALALLSGCISEGPGDLSVTATPTPRAPGGTWHHTGAGAVTFTLTWEGDATVEAEILYPSDTAPYAAGDALLTFDAAWAGWEALAANGGQGVTVHADSTRNVTLRPVDEPFPSLTQHSDVTLSANKGPQTMSFALLAATGGAGVPFELWVNGSSFSIVDGPHDGSARALSFTDWQEGHAAKARVRGYGGTAVVGSRLDWTTVNGTVAFYYRSHGDLESSIYESSRLSSPIESFESEFVSLVSDTVAHDPARSIPHGPFILVSHETAWSYEVTRRVAVDFPVEVFLVGDVKPPRGFVTPEASLLLPRVEQGASPPRPSSDAATP